MSRRKFWQLITGLTLVAVTLFACGAPAPTPTPVVIGVTATSQATPMQVPPTATRVSPTVTATPVLATFTPSSEATVSVGLTTPVVVKDGKLWVEVIKVENAGQSVGESGFLKAQLSIKLGLSQTHYILLLAVRVMDVTDQGIKLVGSPVALRDEHGQSYTSVHRSTDDKCTGYAAMADLRPVKTERQMCIPFVVPNEVTRFIVFLAVKETPP